MLYYRVTYPLGGLHEASRNPSPALLASLALRHWHHGIVYNELVYMGYEISVYNNAGKEIDFLAQRGNKKYFIQVAYSVMEDKAYAREFEAFSGLDNLSQKILITNDDIDYSTSVVRHIKLKDFLLMENLD